MVDTREKDFVAPLAGRTPKKVQPSRISTEVKCETRASQGDHPLDRPAELISAPPLTRLSPIFRASPRPSSRNHPDGNHLSPDVLFLQLEQTPGFVGRAVEEVPRSTPQDPRRHCPRAPEPLAHGGGARVHLARSRGSRGAGRRVGPLKHHHIPIRQRRQPR